MAKAVSEDVLGECGVSLVAGRTFADGYVPCTEILVHGLPSPTNTFHLSNENSLQLGGDAGARLAEY